MNSFTKRILIFGAAVVGFASFAAALSQVVSYKPWGVPDSKRERYDQKLAEIDAAEKLRQKLLTESRPQVAAVVTTHDFGWMNPGETHEFQFPVENQGNEELQLRILDLSNDRIVATLADTVVAPGGETFCTISLTAPAEGNVSQLASAATIQTNDPLNDTLTLGVKAQLTSELVLPETIKFGRHDITDAAETQFVIYSQRSDEFEISDVTCESHQVQWVAIACDPTEAELRGKSATAATRVVLKVQPNDYGKYNDTIDVAVLIGGVEKHYQVEFEGRVRPPIGFYGPDVDSRRGIDFGTVNSGKRHDLFVIVRSRGDSSRHIEILDVEPKQLEAELEPQDTEGTYRLRLSVPADCPALQFNLDSNRGYVLVGDPAAESYSNWLPVYVQVAVLDTK